jgi:hypothetical protein
MYMKEHFSYTMCEISITIIPYTDIEDLKKSLELLQQSIFIIWLFSYPDVFDLWCNRSVKNLTVTLWDMNKQVYVKLGANLQIDKYMKEHWIILYGKSGTVLLSIDTGGAKSH